MAIASPIAIIAMALEVGARWGVPASLILPRQMVLSAMRARVESELAVTAKIKAPASLRGWSSLTISSVSPELDKIKTMSPCWTRPRSPCEASDGCKKK